MYFQFLQRGLARTVQVEAASDRVEQVLNAAFDAVSLPNLGRMPVKLRPSIVHDRFNNAVWIKIPKGSPVRSPASLFDVELMNAMHAHIGASMMAFTGSATKQCLAAACAACTAGVLRRYHTTGSDLSPGMQSPAYVAQLAVVIAVPGREGQGAAGAPARPQRPVAAGALRQRGAGGRPGGLSVRMRRRHRRRAGAAAAAGVAASGGNPGRLLVCWNIVPMW